MNWDITLGITMSNGEKLDWNNKDWIKKLQQQAEESKLYRQKLYKKVDILTKKRILDVGCGTGAITSNIAQSTQGKLIGLDIDSEKLMHAKKLLFNVKNTTLLKADILDLPFKDGTFDLVMFTLVLIHIKEKNQQRAIIEMARVTRKNGIVLASLEPDYKSIIDYPKNPITSLSLKTLKKLGADLQTGRRLKYLFSNAGLKTEVGMDTESEFLMIKDDEKRLEKFLENFWVTEKILKQNGWKENQITKYKKEQAMLIKNGLSFTFSPAFYAIGHKL